MTRESKDEARQGRAPPVEVMINTPLIQDLNSNIPGIKDMTKSTEAGMQTFDQSLFSLHKADLISM